MENFELLPTIPDSREVVEDPLIPRKLHMIWVGADPAPPFVGEYFQGWKTLMPEWDLRLWTNEDIHSTEFSEDYQRLIDSARQGAQKADIMRYYILWKHGGIYMDADVEPHRSLEPLLATKKRLLLCHDLKITWPYIAIGFIAAQPHHPLMENICRKIYSIDIISSTNICMETGPRLLGECAFHLPPQGEKYAVLPKEAFYRNKKGQQLYIDYFRPDDLENRFGSHLYARLWV
jgi:mannosyltransferase OCH1-like enzyme